MYGNEMIHGWGGMWIGPVVVIALVAILLVIWAAGGTGSSGKRNKVDDPRKILDQRLARGEIDEEEYQKRRAAIES